jgi:hypothetical protein
VVIATIPAKQGGLCRPAGPAKRFAGRNENVSSLRRSICDYRIVCPAAER